MARNQIEDLINAKLAEARQRYDEQRGQVKTAAANSAASGVSEASKLASVFRHLAANPGDLDKMAETAPMAGTSAGEVPNNEDTVNMTATQDKTQEVNSLMAQKGTEAVPATNENERDTLKTNDAVLNAITETPKGVADKVAAAENESATSPQEYAAGEPDPNEPGVPFVNSGSAAQAFTKRQAKQVSAVGVLDGLFDAQAYRDGALHRNFVNAEAAGVKTRS